MAGNARCKLRLIRFDEFYKLISQKTRKTAQAN